jgi:GNAT superfamily N-acetyltransferase
MQQAEYTISTDQSRFDVEMIYAFLTRCYWAEGVPRDVVQRSIENALCFGIFDGNAQVGFARVITDRATHAYVGDVFILESHRGRGLGKRLMQAIMEHPELQGFRRWSLVTSDAWFVRAIRLHRTLEAAGLYGTAQSRRLQGTKRKT